MIETQPFPESRSELEKLYLWDFPAEAVLLAPRIGRGHQGIMLLQGSEVRRRLVESCSAKTCRIRWQWKDSGIMVEKGYRLVLTRDVPLNSVSLAACVVMGASKNGWDLWHHKGRSLDEAWSCAPSENGLVFYDSKSEMPPVPARADEVFSISDPRCVRQKRRTTVAKTGRVSLHTYELPKKKTLNVEKANQSVIECRSGQLRVSALGIEKMLSPSEFIVFDSRHAHKIVAVKDSVLRATVCNTS